MPFLVGYLSNGRTTWWIEHHAKSRKARERLGKETARIEITDKAAALGIDELVKLLAPKESVHGT